MSFNYSNLINLKELLNEEGDCEMEETDDSMRKIINEIKFKEISYNQKLLRKICWQGNIDYNAGPFNETACEFTPCVKKIVDYVNVYFGIEFDGVFFELYEDGFQSVGWHADFPNFIDFDSQCPILSFEDAYMCFKNKYDDTQKFNVFLPKNKLTFFDPQILNNFVYRIPLIIHPIPKRLFMYFKKIKK